MPRPRSITVSVDSPTVEQQLKQDEQEKRALVGAFVSTAQHFLGGFTQLFRQVADPRAPHLILYPLVSLALTGVLLFAGHLKSRRQIGKLLRQNGSSADHFGALTGVAGCPQGDTLNAAFKRMNPSEFQ